MMKPGIFFMLLLVMSLLAACGGASSTPTPSIGVENGLVADFEEILVTGPILDSITPSSASLRVVTSVDIICSWPHGPTTNYGQVATHADMGMGEGGHPAVGHKIHNPVLLNLQPDIVYHYRFVGVGPDGRVYRSKDHTFQTSPVETTGLQPQSGANLALLTNGARVAGASSTFGGGDDDSTWGANRAFDGDPTTQWSSDADGDNAWIELELPTNTEVTSLGFWTRTMGTSAQIFSFRVVTDQGEVYGPFKLDDAATVHYFTSGLTAKRLRFEADDTNGGNTGAVEIEVYGIPGP